MRLRTRGVVLYASDNYVAMMSDRLMMLAATLEPCIIIPSIAMDDLTWSDLHSPTEAIQNYRLD